MIIKVSMCICIYILLNRYFIGLKYIYCEAAVKQLQAVIIKIINPISQQLDFVSFSLSLSLNLNNQIESN